MLGDAPFAASESKSEVTSMRGVARWAVVIVAVVHGMLHLLGAAKGLGIAEVMPLTEPIGTGMGVAWLAGGALVVVAGVLLAVRSERWWLVAGSAAVVSQGLIVTSWGDAAAGTVANAILLGAAVYGFASTGPRSHRREYRRAAADALAGLRADGVVTDDDLVHLPDVVAEYIRGTGAVGRPRVVAFRARLHGRIRAQADRPWMAFTAEQTNVYGQWPARLFHMDATMLGLPVDVLHAYVGSEASMRGKVCSLFPVLDVDGEEMTRAETVTLLNDLCIFAPAALVDAPITWEVLGDRRVAATYTNAGHQVRAELVFDDRHDLVDFVSDDRLAASPDGKTFERRRWSTPLRDHRDVGPARLATAGEAWWHPEGEPDLVYIELHLDKVAYNPGVGAVGNAARTSASVKAAAPS
jgi:hypothetical protein